MARMLNKYETCDGTTIIYAPHKDQIIEVLIDTEDQVIRQAESSK